MNAAPTVFVVDDDPLARDSVRRLAESVGLPVETFADARHFLDTVVATRLGCVVADVRMPGLSGLDLQKELAARQCLLPVILLTGHPEIPLAVRAMKDGAFDFLEKPFSPQVMLDRIQQAIDANRRARQEADEIQALATRTHRLTAREREVMDRIVAGKPNRAIAADLGIAEKTVEFHRANVMAKLEVSSIAALVRIGLLTRSDGR